MDHEIERNESKTNIQNENFESDVEYAIKLNRWLLKPFGIWPLNSTSTKFDRRISKISPPICCCLLLFLIIPSIIEMFVNEKDFKARLEIVGPTSFSVMVTIKYIVFITRGEELKMCIDTIINDWRNIRAKQQRAIMTRNAKIARLFTIICVSFMYCGGIFYSVLLPLITAKSLSSDYNLTVRILPYRCNFIYFDPYRRPVFDIVYVVHCFCSVVMYSITTGVCSLAAKFVMHACGQCEIVMSLLDKLIDDNKCCSDIVKSKLAIIVLHHLHMIRCSLNGFPWLIFALVLVTAHNETVLYSIWTSKRLTTKSIFYRKSSVGVSKQSSLGLETADTAKFVTFALLFMSFTFNIFVFCYIGQILTDHCHQIGEASYMIDWYRIPGIQARFLVLLIGISNRPIILTAGKMVPLSYPCFCNVIKAAMAYLNILRTVAI